MSPSSSGFGLATEAEQPAGAETSVIGDLSSYSKSMKYSGSATRSVTNFDKGGRLLERHGDVELDEVVGPLFHPVVRHRTEVDRLAADLEGGEIADVGEAAGVLLGQRRETAPA